MKNYSISGILLSFIVLSVLGFSSCDTRLNGCPKDIAIDMCLYNVLFQIYNADSTENLLAINSYVYNKDSVKIFNEQWEEVNYSIDQSGDVYLNISEGQELLTNSELSSRFYISFEKKDVDTMQFHYQLKYECDYYQFIYFKSFYNQTEYSTNYQCTQRFRVYKK